MMILWQVRNIVAGKLGHGILKPIIICIIYIFHGTRRLGMRVSPRRGATATRLLGNGKRDTLVKRPGKECQFASIGATGDAYVI
jgi:hypothetical protein